MEREMMHRLLRDMMLSRIFEERAAEEYGKGNIVGFLHLYPGEEAVAAGVINAAGPSDYIVSTYREHAHALVRGVSARAVMAELFGRASGMSGGMGGSMHMFDRERRFMGGYAIVGETYPIAIGIGYAVMLRSLPETVVCFFGDGAVNQGTFHESLNMAGLWRLPVLFVCENNHYAIGTDVHRHSAVPEIYRRAAAYNIPAEKIDGMDVLKVYQATRHALDRIRRSGGPQFLEFETYRYRGHSMADPGTYRPAVEVKAYQAIDPLTSARARSSTVIRVPRNWPRSDPTTSAGSPSTWSHAGHLEEAEVARMKKEVKRKSRMPCSSRSPARSRSMDDAWRHLNCNRGHDS